MFRVLRQTAREFVADECHRLAAALAYYAIFSLPALLVMVVAVASLFADSGQVSDRLTRFFDDSLGSTGAKQIETILKHAQQPGQGWWGWLVGVAVLVFGATGVLLELQTALNRVWGVKPDDEQGGVRAFLMKRVLSLAMVLGIAFLLLVSLVVSWLLGEFSNLLHRYAPDWLSAGAIRTIDVVASLTIIAALFAALLKYLPDARLVWRDVLPGAVLTAVLFGAGKYALSIYLAYSDITGAYGAAGSLALVLLWIYYSAMIFFFGAEFTQVLSTRRGKRVEPEPGATLAQATKPTAA